MVGDTHSLIAVDIAFIADKFPADLAIATDY